MSDAQSFKVGYDVVDMGVLAARNVYEALRAIECAGCGENIAPGERFTRHKMQGGGPRQFPMCQQCEPFTEFRELAEDKRPPVPPAGVRASLGYYGNPDQLAR
jgi:hypothetical protein